MTTIQNKLKSADLSVAPGKGGLMSFPGITAESSRKLSELLQKNQEDYHGFFSDLGVYPISVYLNLLHNTDTS